MCKYIYISIVWNEGNMERMCEGWPPIKGEYVVGEPTSGVAVCTLASRLPPSTRAALWGGCMTENLGVEKVVLNIISNSHIRYLIVCGAESKGHLPGDALISLHTRGVDEAGRIRGAMGAIPYVEHLQKQAVERFQRQVDIVDMREVVDVQSIHDKVEELCRAEIFDEPPMVWVKEDRTRECIEISGADAVVADGVLVDVMAGVVFCEEEVC